MPKETREFHAQILDWKQIHELPDGWPPARLLALLTLMEVDDVPESEAHEMALLALQDREPDEAAELILETVFGDTMRSGVRRNLAQQLTEDRPWEDFADVTQQSGIFNTVVLLQQAFPREFDKPDAVSTVVRFDTESTRGRAWLDIPNPDPALLLRILAAGMGDRAVLARVFGDAIRGTSFKEARAVLWHVSRHASAESAREFLLISSHQWFDPLKNLEEWTATAWADAPGLGENTKR